jgi:hypothetical protein|tara:strand:+ start:2122 stop:3882 length:1761 start_codon:yes stop_codon:yes gene_type:complete
MAKQLPQFKAATPAYQQQRVVRQPNYADIYARSYANTVNAYSRLYQPVLGAIDKININIQKEQKEKELRVKKAGEAGLTYQNAIYTGIDENLAGKFEDKFEAHLSKNADAFTQNELDHANGKITYEMYAATKKKLFAELNDTEKAAQTMRKGLEFFSANKDNMSLYQNSKLFGLFEAFENGGRNIEIGRNELGNTIYSYIDDAGKEQAFTLDEVNELIFGETENALNLKIDYTSDGSEGKTLLDALEKNIRNSEGFEEVQTKVFSVINTKGNQQVETTSTAYKDTQYIIRSAQNSDLLESLGESFRARHYQDQMLNPAKGTFLHNLNVQANDIISYLKVTEGKDYSDKKDAIMRIITSYNEDDDFAKEDSFIGSIRSAQKEMVKKDIANKLFNERFAQDEKPTQTIIKNITDNQKRAAKLVNDKNFVDQVESKFSMIDSINRANFNVEDSGLPSDQGKTAMANIYALFGAAVKNIENKADIVDEGTRNESYAPGYIEFTLSKEAIGSRSDLTVKIDENTPSSYLAELLWSINDFDGNAADIYEFWNNKGSADDKDSPFYNWVAEQSTKYQTELDKIGYQPGDEDFN